LPSELMATCPRFDEVLEYLRRKGEFEVTEDSAEAWSSQIDGSYQSFQRRRPNGVTLEIRSVPLPGGGVVRTFTDVSELLKKERLSVLGQLTATVAHELRNPLSAIRNTVPVIRELTAGTGVELDRPMSRIERSIVRCDQLVTGLLDYTRPSVLSCKPTYVDSWLDGLLNEQTAPDGIVIERNFSAPDCLVNVDVERFRRVIINLMDNAAQAIAQDQRPGADRRITIATETSDHVEIIIRDTGPGIPADVLPKIFEPLFSTKNFGTGLGLPTIKQLVEQHGGKISIDSESGRGTTARVSLPLSNHQKAAA
jgi:signal transduction histidine kinase